MKLSEIKSVFNYIISNNETLISEGKKPTALCLEGEAGIGKTAIIEEIANERKMTYVKLVLSQLEEVGDLAGFPIKQYLVKEYKEVDGETVTETKWVAEAALFTYANQPCHTYEVTATTRMAYAPPAWLPVDENPKGTILCLDDFSRASSVFMQAIMELVDKGSYMTWKLPKNTTIVLSSNPDDGSYHVSGLDAAQTSRMCKFTADFDIKDWARWAELSNIDSRAINFALNYSTELFSTNDTRVKGLNARSYTTFCNVIQGIENWENPDSLGLIIDVSRGCFADEDGIVGGLFTQFIQNKLDRLIDPKDMLLGKWETVLPIIIDNIYSDGNYNSCIAAMLSTRLTNYTIKYLKTSGSKEDVVVKRMEALIKQSGTDKRIFSADIVFNACKILIHACPTKTKTFCMSPVLRDKILN